MHNTKLFLIYFCTKILKMKKFLILMLFPLFITAQKSQLNNDLRSDNHSKRNKL